MRSILDSLGFRKRSVDGRNDFKNLPKITVTKEMIRNNKEECCICLSEYKIGEMQTILPCTHKLHYDCGLKCMKEKNECPLCKMKLN